MGGRDTLNELDLEDCNAKQTSPGIYRLPPLTFSACGFAELGEAISGTMNIVRGAEVVREAWDDEDNPGRSRKTTKPKSWTEVVSDRPEEWNPAGLGTLESLHNQTTVRIKWLGSASR